MAHGVRRITSGRHGGRGVRWLVRHTHSDEEEVSAGAQLTFSFLFSPGPRDRTASPSPSAEPFGSALILFPELRGVSKVTQNSLKFIMEANYRSSSLLLLK